MPTNASADVQVRYDPDDPPPRPFGGRDAQSHASAQCGASAHEAVGEALVDDHDVVTTNRGLERTEVAPLRENHPQCREEILADDGTIGDGMVEVGSVCLTLDR
jgi:hypothetical protein